MSEKKLFLVPLNATDEELGWLADRILSGQEPEPTAEEPDKTK